MGMTQQVGILGKVPHSQIPHYLESADLAVFPYEWRAGAGNAVFEAMAMGVPVVVPFANKILEQLSIAGCAYGIPHLTQAALTEALTTLATDDHLRQELAVRGETWVRLTLDPENVASLWKAVTDRVRALRA